MKAALIGAITIIVFGGGQSPAPVEQRLIGTWAGETFRTSQQFNHANKPALVSDTLEIVFTRDHKELWRYRGRKVQAVARWHLDGRDLVFTLESPLRDVPAGTTRRERIKKVTSDTLVFTDGSQDTVWTRVR
jgi:hypothetical protein